ncbi:MBL fold metallo-hydrolase [Chromobacterium haemolyticum]|nr:MBL fold metallo-hydrolase [Chromobacterium haemolyticum]
MIDPIWSQQRASPLQWAGPERQLPPPMALQELPAIDLVLITHNHYDHLDFNTVSRLARQPASCPHFAAPLGVGATLRRAGVPVSHIHELDWWQRYRLDGVEAELTPAHHWSKRWMFGDENRALWGGFAVRGDGLQFWYPGDTGYQDQLFRLIGERIGLVDLWPCCR